ncbi:MAG: hypothetical protein HZA49_06385 [Planctomycetes bacterium]|nr:hypothetical protein [Planctomycetota bacterium]
MWQIEKTTKRCQECNSTIEVSQHYFSALFPNPTDKTGEPRLLRRDFCANCWERRTAAGEEPPFSFWQTVIEPPAEPPKTPREVLLNFFDNLFKEATEVPAAENTSVPVVQDTRLKSQVKYLFALIMMRKKLLRLKSPLTRDNTRYLVLERFAKPQRSPDNFGGDAKVYEVAEVNISDEELDSLRQEFSQLFEFRI